MGATDSSSTTKIKGIGGVRADQLRKAGVHTVADLAGTTPDVLAGHLGNVPRSTVAAWIRAAARLSRPQVTSERHSAIRATATSGEHEADAAQPIVIDASLSSQTVRAGHLIGGGRVAPRFLVIANGGKREGAVAFASTAVAHILGGGGWRRLGRTVGSLTPGTSVHLRFPETSLPAGIYSVVLTFSSVD